MRTRVSICALVLVTAGCVTTLPDQDLRIRDSPPVAKMPADILWKEYQADAKEADRKYWGKAIEVSGTVTRSDTADTGGPSANYLFFRGSDQFGVRANLIDEDAAEIMKVVGAGQRVRLKCFCAGLDGNVILKSCIKG
ncbi:MAG TPA: hypothetical protein VES67_23245 [Vicinamibacterales bacterium]|nr:hypothetical protein [Vicinamibacterales bacterium]